MSGNIEIEQTLEDIGIILEWTILAITLFLLWCVGQVLLMIGRWIVSFGTILFGPRGYEAAAIIVGALLLS